MQLTVEDYHILGHTHTCTERKANPRSERKKPTRTKRQKNNTHGIQKNKTRTERKNTHARNTKNPHARNAQKNKKTPRKDREKPLKRFHSGGLTTGISCRSATASLPQHQGLKAHGDPELLRKFHNTAPGPIPRFGWSNDAGEDHRSAAALQRQFHQGPTD